VFFMAVGMSIDLTVLVARPGALLAIGAILILVKFAVLYGLGRWWGLCQSPARRLGIVLSQGGEFAFVLFSVGLIEGVIGRDLASLLTLAVTLSMAATPLLLLADDWFLRARKAGAPDYEMPPEAEQHVIIAGFGRFGQIVARVLRARHIPFTALDTSIAQIDFVKRFGAKIYYGDAGRIDILRAAGADKATAFVLAINNTEASLKVAQIVRQNFPDLPIYARARDRTHVHKLLDLGVEIIERETFLSAIELTTRLLRGLGLKPAEVKRLIATFKRHDERRLYDEYKDYTDSEKMRVNALTAAVELEDLFANDLEDLENGGGANAPPRDDRGSSG
jgi:voltage-gated potassium channel Kch